MVESVAAEAASVGQDAATLAALTRQLDALMAQVMTEG